MYKFPNYYPISEKKDHSIGHNNQQFHNFIYYASNFPKPLQILRSQFGSTEGAESEVCVHRTLAEAAAQGFCHRPRRFGGRRQRVIVGEKVLTIGAMVERILGRPPPHGNKEELENLVGVHKIDAAAAVRALAHTGFQNLSHLLL